MDAIVQIMMYVLLIGLGIYAAYGLVMLAYRIKRAKWFQVTIHTLLFPWYWWRVDRMFKRMSPRMRRKAYSHYVTADHWTNKYWFGKRIFRLIGKKYILKHS